MTTPCDFASFWHGGPLHAFAYACLASFPKEGARLGLYGYDAGLEVPPGVALMDARAICPDETLVSRYLANGKPSIATFADMFRYRMIRATGLCWVDTDLVCLRRPAFANDPYVFCRQADAVSALLVNNAVLRLPRDDPALAELVATADAAAGVDGRWGALGPFLLTPALEKHGLYARAFAPRVCYPIEPEQFWKPFLPAFRDEVATKVEGATFLHLWSEAIRWSGYDYRACPPEGSFLHERFERLGVLGRFARTSDEDEVLRRMGEQIAASRARPAAPSGGDG
ncbi:hypothetical protein DFR50_12187 [Roseiarcus fermentans]|uniref:Alpha 1,4-glycosyltransferase n=1 Tax=Roseiarcus fermentans TaxID=1473586 RepID=A0A366F518_9HYPH|nr:hypothetical protein [Roseiarcus fermentans]RBP09741.1 hypothetical protein DFR50_12187 [Roseiarcus fermentans]